MKKACTKCNKEKDFGSFYKNKNCKFGTMSICKICDNNRKTEFLRKKSAERNRKEGKKAKRLTLVAKKDKEVGKKYCPKCESVKIFDLFYTNKASRNGYSSHCINCMNEIGKSRPKEERQKRYIKRRRQVRNTNLIRHFGITIEKYDQMLKEQSGVCAICGKTPKENKKALAVDHHHKENKIRGLLCNNCNVAMGFLSEDVDIAYATIDYIKKWAI